MTQANPAERATETTPERTHFRACNLCEAICGLEIRVRGTEILSIRGDDADPLSRGHICPKAVALKDIHQDPDRLRKPMRRTADGWEEISWDAALDLAAERLVAISQEHGAASIAAYYGNPNVHNYGSMTHGSRALAPLKTRNRYSATSVDQLPHQLLAYWMYGHQLLLPIADIDRCDYFLVLGANPMASNGSLMTVPDFRARLKALQARGGRMVLLDPRRTETAEVADAHHFIRPGTDAAFLLGLLKTIFDEGLAQPGKLAPFADGIEAAAQAIGAFEVEALSVHCGIPAETIRRIAREFAAAKCAAAYGRIGVSIQRWGTLSQWLIQLLNIVTGNLDREGGVLFPQPAVDMIDSPASKPGHFASWKSRVRGLPEFAGELPVAALAEEILTPGEGQIRALLTSAGNPVLSTPNGAQLDRALDSLEFMVSVDIYLNETTRHADLILPPTSALEHDHYDLIFHVFAVRNTARYSEPLFDKPEGALHDWEIFEGLGARIAQRLGVKHQPSPRPDQIIDMGLRSGPYGGMRKHPLDLSLTKLKQQPSGIDLGPLLPSLPQRLQHADKRIRCTPPEVLAELESFASELPEALVDGALSLIGRRHLRSNNSWMHNSARLVKGPTRHQLLMHPQDLAARGLLDGSAVRIRSRAGEVVVKVESSDEVMPGVVSLPHGWGHDRSGTRMGVAQAHAGASNNDLTDETYLDRLSGNAALNGVPVTVEAA
ncbi:MAG: molybdopterin oxidoreductase family protein [Nevskia sp.]|nr:molybdopterin oxidoreductase family protein [Nevskia sp.]